MYLGRKNQIIAITNNDLDNKNLYMGLQSSSFTKFKSISNALH